VIHQEDTNKMYLVMNFVALGPIGTTKFWKYRNKRNKLPAENRLMPTRDAKYYFRQLVSGLYHSK
jgi:serine/threonine protein kinase